MPYIYRYKNLDGAIKYVGIIKADTNMPNRFYHHKNDEWHSKSPIWTIEYAYYETQCDVEALEAHLIAEYTEQGEELYNTAKTGWGKSSFIDSRKIDWAVFSENDIPQTASLSQRSKHLTARLSAITEELYDIRFSLNSKMDSLRAAVYDLRNRIEDEEKDGFVNWFHDNVAPIPIEHIVRACDELGCKVHVTVRDFYDDYISWIYANDIAIHYNRDEFEDRICSRNGVFERNGIQMKDGVLYGALLITEQAYEKANEYKEHQTRQALELMNNYFEEVFKTGDGNGKNKALPGRNT